MKMDAQDVTRLFDVPYYQLEQYPLQTALATKYNGNWEKLSTKEYLDRANQLSRGLMRLGVKPNDKVAVISSTNRTEWNICDIGILQTGAQNVPMYPTISKEDYEYILNHSEAKFCFVSDADILQKLNAIKDNTKLEGVYTFDQIDGEDHYSKVLEMGEDDSIQDELEERKKAVKSDDVATLIYTSGTTGRPKGVMLSHNNIVANVHSSAKRVPLLNGEHKALSFLPLCHIFERMIIYLYQYSGISIYYAESIEKITDNIQEVKPQVMTAVPRLYEKIYDKIVAKGTDLTGVKKKLFFWALDLGLRYEPYGQNGWWYEQQLKLARKLIFSKWREALGGNIEIMVSGGAALQQRLTRVFTAAGLPIMEGYGLTETSPVVAVADMRNGGFKVGTVGRIIDGVEVKIAEDGEICVKGPNVMQGYYKDPEKSAEVLKDGYFHTGDIGEVKDGYLRITDRKKEMFKTSGGKYIAPQIIENQLKQSRFIEQAMIVGEGEKMPAAFIQPNYEFLKEWAKRKGLNFQTNQDLIANQDVQDRIKREIEESNTHFGNWEQIKKFELTPTEWSVDGGQLTPKMSMKRRVIKEMYKDLYDKMYS